MGNEEMGRPQADTSAVDRLLAEIPSEGEATETGIQDGPAASPAEQPKTEAAPVAEGAKEEAKVVEPKAEEEKLPFHKHSRWKAMREENKRKDEAIDELRKSIEELKSKPKSEDAPTIPQEFKELFGDNMEHWQKFQKLTAQQAESIVNARFQQAEAQNSKASQETARWTKWVDEQMSVLSEETGMELTDEDSSERNEILKVALDYSPTDKEGNIDLRKAMDLWKALKGTQQKSEERKKVAAQTVEDKADAAKPDKTVGLSELKGKNWRDFFPN